jgi:hypothetical protein
MLSAFFRIEKGNKRIKYPNIMERFWTLPYIFQYFITKLTFKVTPYFVFYFDNKFDLIKYSLNLILFISKTYLIFYFVIFMLIWKIETNKMKIKKHQSNQNQWLTLWIDTGQNKKCEGQKNNISTQNIWTFGKKCQ